MDRDPHSLLEMAEQEKRRQNWTRMRELAEEALRAGAPVTEGLTARTHANQMLGDLDPAIADLTLLVGLHPQEALFWRGRGACRIQKASALRDRAEARRLMDEAHDDYRRASELKPDDELVGLDLLELEICLGKYREAIGTTGQLWSRIQPGPNKLVCAWLGAIAFILGGRPEQKWAHLAGHVERASERLTPNDWVIREIDRLLASLPEGLTGLAQARCVHEEFLRHYDEAGGGRAAGPER